MKKFKKIKSLKDLGFYGMAMLFGTLSMLLFIIDMLLLGSNSFSVIVVILGGTFYMVSIISYFYSYPKELENLKLGLLSWVVYSSWKSDTKKKVVQNITGIIVMLFVLAVFVFYVYLFTAPELYIWICIFSWFVVTGLLVIYFIIIVIGILVRPFIVGYYILFASSERLIAKASSLKFLNIRDTLENLGQINISWVAKILMWRGRLKDIQDFWGSYKDYLDEFASPKFFFKYEEKLQKTLISLGDIRMFERAEGFLRHCSKMTEEEIFALGFELDEFEAYEQNFFDLLVDKLPIRDGKIDVSGENNQMRGFCQRIYTKHFHLLKKSKSRRSTDLECLWKRDRKVLLRTLNQKYSAVSRSNRGKYSLPFAKEILDQIKSDIENVSPYNINLAISSLQNSLDLDEQERLSAEKKEEIEEMLRSGDISPFYYRKTRDKLLSSAGVYKIIDANIFSILSAFDPQTLLRYDSDKCKNVYDKEPLEAFLHYLFDILSNKGRLAGLAEDKEKCNILEVKIRSTLSSAFKALRSFQFESIDKLLKRMRLEWIEKDEHLESNLVLS